MAIYSFSNRAVEDLNEIWDYTVEEWSENQAEKYINLIIASCQDLADNPQLGKCYDVISDGILGYKCGAHLIFYQSFKSQIVIQRVLHGMMDIPNQL